MVLSAGFSDVVDDQGKCCSVVQFIHTCPYQLGNKCSKETILNIWRNEKYFSILLIYQLVTIKAKSNAELFFYDDVN